MLETHAVHSEGVRLYSKGSELTDGLLSLGGGTRSVTKRGDSKTPVSPSMEQGRLEKVLPRGPYISQQPYGGMGPVECERSVKARKKWVLSPSSLPTFTFSREA